MPWRIEEKDGKYCVVKIATGETVKCHNNRTDALKHQKALYANEPQMKYSVLAFSDTTIEDTEDPNVKWVKAWRYSTWDHPKYGKVEITPAHGMKFRTYLQEGTFGRNHLVNYDHGADPAKGGKSAGQILDIEPREDGIWYQCKFTDNALNEISAGEWRYLSPEYDDWLNPETGEIFEDMPFDLALCNTPFFKGMPPLNFSELYTEEIPKDFADWSTAYKNDLPDSAFLYVEPGGKKDSDGKTTPRSFRHFPYKDKDGKIDEPHLRNAIARIPQADIPASLKNSLQARARRLLGNAGGSPKGGTVDELLRQFAERLGFELTEDMDTDAILAKADELNATIEPLRKAKGDAERTRTFREAFPDEYKEMEKLRKTRVDSEAKAFSENYRRFTITAGDREYKSTHGFSELVLDQITETYRKFSERSASPADLKKLMDLIGDKGIVDYSEHGSSRGISGDREWNEDPKLAFAEAVQKVMEDDSVPYEAAMTIAMQKHQDLYEEYLKAIPQR